MFDIRVNEVIQMLRDSTTMVAMTEVDQNLSKVAHLVDEVGAAVNMKNNMPRYPVIDFRQADRMDACTDADLLAVSKELISKNRQAYEELAE